MNLKKWAMRGFLFAFVLLVSSSARAGGPWLLPQGSGFVQLQATVPVYAYSALLNGTFRDTFPINRTVFNLDVGFYGEFGLFDKLDVMLSLPLKYVASGELTGTTDFKPTLPEGNLFGFSNIRLGLKYGLVDTNVKFAVSVQVGANSINRDVAKGLQTGYDAWSVGLFFHLGGSLTRTVYMFFEAGYNIMTGGYSHLVDGHLELGWNFWGPLSLVVTFDAKISVRNGTLDRPRLVQTGMYPNDQEFVLGSVKFVFQSKSGFGASIGTGLIPIWLKYVGFSGAITAGVFYKW